MNARSLLIENMKYYRGVNGYSQEKLAEIIGLEKSTIGKIESGSSDPSFATLQNLAKAFHIDLYLLFKKRTYPEIEDTYENINAEVKILLYRNKDKKDYDLAAENPSPEKKPKKKEKS